MVQLKYVKGEIFVYDVNDWKTLRRDHRIVGHIIGSTSFIPSLPAKLLPEEALLLLDNNVAEIHETCNLINAELTQNFKQILLKTQQVEYRKIRKAQIETLIDKIIEQRRKIGDYRTKEDIFNEELDKSSVITEENMAWPILLNDDKSRHIPVSREAVSLLTTPLKLAIFKDLWKRGYHITSGEKFGGDFLVYCGDPIVHHAIFIVKCTEGEKTFAPIDLIAFGRLGVAVKKRSVLGSLRNGQVSYMTINWIDA